MFNTFVLLLVPTLLSASVIQAQAFSVGIIVGFSSLSDIIWARAALLSNIHGSAYWTIMIVSIPAAI